MVVPLVVILIASVVGVVVFVYIRKRRSKAEATSGVDQATSSPASTTPSKSAQAKTTEQQEKPIPLSTLQEAPPPSYQEATKN